MKFAKLLSMVLLVIFVAGCADMDIPNPVDVIKDPFVGGGLSKGMSKPEVISKYGEPNVKTIVSSSEWGGQREEWLYKANYSVLPVNAGYLSDDLYLYFDADNLTNISKKPLGKHVKEIVDQPRGGLLTN